jgi:hypothetical protein
MHTQIAHVPGMSQVKLPSQSATVYLYSQITVKADVPEHFQNASVC